jgi:hypothetical protein
MKLWYLLKEMWRLIRRERVWVLAPLLMLMVLVALLAFYVGPGAVVTFIYAGL